MPLDDTSENIDLLHIKVKDLVRQKKTDEEIVEALKREGINEDYAQVIIANVQNDIHDKKNFWKLLIGGIFFIVGGLTVSYLSDRMTKNTGGLFFDLFWVIVVAGIILVIKAFIIFKK